MGEGLWAAVDLTCSLACLETQRPDNCSVDPGWAHTYKEDPKPSLGSSRSRVEAAGTHPPSPKAPNGASVQAATLVAPGPELDSRSPIGRWRPRPAGSAVFKPLSSPAAPTQHPPSGKELGALILCEHPLGGQGQRERNVDMQG